MSKLYNLPIEIEKKNGGHFFQWNNKLYRINRTIKKWHQKDHWWNPKQSVDRVYAIVQANSSVFELYYCKLTKQCFLSRIID